MSANSDGYNGLLKPATDEYNALSFLVAQIINGRHHVEMVKVMAVDTDEKTVDVQPLVNQIDGQGQPVEHGVVNDLPYFRLQGGANAIIIEPEVGDIGLCLFCDRDVSAVKATKAMSNPGSRRRSDFADGAYIGGLLNGIPEQYVSFSPDGILIKSPTAIKLDAPEITMTCESLTVDASSFVKITTPQFTVEGSTKLDGYANITGNTDINGNTHVNGNTNIDGNTHVGGNTNIDGAASVTGNVSSQASVSAPNVTGSVDVLAGTVSLRTHLHIGVSSGSAISGPPKP